MIRALIFDLCDTVVRTAGVPGLLGLPGLAGRYSAEDMNDWFVGSAVFMAYERGEVDTAVFLETFRRELNIDASDVELSQVYEALILHEIAGVPAWVRRLGKQFPLYALSNNNPRIVVDQHGFSRSTPRAL